MSSDGGDGGNRTPVHIMLQNESTKSS